MSTIHIVLLNFGHHVSSWVSYILSDPSSMTKILACFNHLCFVVLFNCAKSEIYYLDTILSLPDVRFFLTGLITTSRIRTRACTER